MNSVSDITSAIFSEWDVVSPGVTLAEIGLPPEVCPKLPFNFAEFEVAPGSATILESHSVREMWYVLEGEGYMQGKETNKSIARGNFLFMESQVPHRVVNRGATAFKALAIWW